MSKKALLTGESTETELHRLTNEITQFQDQTDVKIKEQAKTVNDHERVLSKHKHELQSTQNLLSAMKVKQTNEASRVSYAVKEITSLSQDQKKSSQQMKEAISQFSYTGKQLTDQVSELSKHLVITGEETSKQVSDLEKQISSMQQQLQETTSRLKFDCMLYAHINFLVIFMSLY